MLRALTARTAARYPVEHVARGFHVDVLRVFVLLYVHMAQRVGSGTITSF
jgi:hypothetical protein